jgi:hypothetical protein
MEPHWGPRIEKIPIRGGIGAIIAIGLMIGFLAEVLRPACGCLLAFTSASSLGSSLFAPPMS